MRACKIEIKQIWLDFNGFLYREAIRDQIMAKVMEDGKTPDITKITEQTYLPVKVYEPGATGFTTYLVKDSEQKVFKDLMTIQDDTLNEAVRAGVEKRWEKDLYRIEAEERNRIRNLPWYERLFNKF